jgi:hypothetical protein
VLKIVILTTIYKIMRFAFAFDSECGFVLVPKHELSCLKLAYSLQFYHLQSISTWPGNQDPPKSLPYHRAIQSNTFSVPP